MTVESSTVISGPFIGNGVTVLFPRGFSVGDADHVTVTVDGVVITTGYTVLDPTLPTGDVQFAVAPAAGEVIYLTRDTPITQETDYSSQGSVSPEQVEDDVDYRTRVEQENRRDIDRSLKVELGQPGPSVTVGAVDTVPIWNVGGDLEEGPGAGDIADAQGHAAQTALDVIQTGIDSAAAIAAVTAATSTLTKKAFIADGIETEFTLDFAPTDVQNTQVFINGIKQFSTGASPAYFLSGAIITFVTAPLNLDLIEITVASVYFIGSAPLVTGGLDTYATRTLLKAVAPTAGDLAYLAEGARAGNFTFMVGDYSTQVTADTQEGIYLKADSLATTVGAWVRQYSLLPSVKWFGALGNDAAADLIALQAATDLVKAVFIPNGIYRTNAAWLMDDDAELYSQSAAAEIKSTSATAIIEGRDPTVTRNFWLRIHGGTFRGNGSCKGIDLLSFTDVKIYNTWITACSVGILNGGAGSVGAFYNEGHGLTITTCGVGVRNGTLGNEFKMFGGRITDVTLGTDDDDNSGNSYYGVAVETFTLGGHRVSNSGDASIDTRFIGSRLENPVSGYGSATGFLLAANAQDTIIIAPGFTSVATKIVDSGIRTQILFSEDHNNFAGGTPFKTIKRITVSQSIPSIAAGLVRQDSFTLAGVADGDAVSVTLPATWPNGLMASPPISASGLVYLQLHNPTGGALSMAADDFHFSIIDYT